MNGAYKAHRIYKSHSRRSRRDSRFVESEANLETELNVARPAGSDHGVGAGHVRRRRHFPERVAEADAVVEQDRWVGEVRMMQDVEDLGAELHADALGGFEGLDQREVPIVEAGAAEDVAPCCSETGRVRLSQHTLERNRARGREVGNRFRIA